jgi:hypothetical protein
MMELGHLDEAAKSVRGTHPRGALVVPCRKRYENGTMQIVVDGLRRWAGFA